MSSVITRLKRYIRIVIEAMGDESKHLISSLVDEVTAYTGERGGEIAVAQTLAAQMEEVC